MEECDVATPGRQGESFNTSRPKSSTLPAKECEQGEQRQPSLPVVLQMEVTTRRQALAIQAALWALMLALVGLAIALLAKRNYLLSLRNSSSHEGAYYPTMTGVAAACLAGLLVLGGVFVTRMRREILMTAAWMAAFALVVAAECVFPAVSVAILAQLRWTCISTLLLWLTARMHSMTLHRGPSAWSFSAAVSTAGRSLKGCRNAASRCQCGIGQHTEQRSSAAHEQAVGPGEPTGEAACVSCTPDTAGAGYVGGAATPACHASPTPAAATANGSTKTVQQLAQQSAAAARQPPGVLVVELPLRQQLRLHVWKVALWAVLEGVYLMTIIRQFQGDKVVIALNKECLADVDASCEPGTRQLVGMAIQTAGTLIYVALYLYYQALAFRDHRKLPYVQYRITNLYVRVQLGLPPVQLSLAVMVFTSVFLYMPASQLGAPILQAYLQEFAWSRAELPAKRRERTAHLLEASAGLPTFEEQVLPALGVLPDKAQATADAAAVLEKEPMFCMELALRLFLWSRLAYQYGIPGSPVKQGTALELFGLQEWFYNAWRGQGFAASVLTRLEGIIASSHVSQEALTIYVTGHSLGGALAELAAFEIRKRWPQVSLAVYTLGAPRLGNKAWAAEYDQAVPETWAIVNDEDPVPRVPKLFYKRGGQRVSIDMEGDIIVRPSYFERAILTKTGGSVKHHMTGAYGLALAAILKSQFVPGKALPGGAEGVRQLAACLDMGAALVVRNLDLKSLQDPKTLPQPIAVKKPQRVSLRLPIECGAMGCPSCWGAGPQAEQQSEEDVVSADGPAAESFLDTAAV
ncbi:hypothetical protein N2152v2_002882 [Parachlorella kessleri]